ncbi:MAG TPA: ribbon-helix-helix domain-containing protein [Candidatus Desulfaltia sp.]|nr:ribbon-helix-helix domain-containing protein [Candidatus Desulfaltia sp.]
MEERSMAGSTVNISFNQELLGEIDKTAKQEARTRSELIREAARLYIGRKNRWEKIFAFGSRQAQRLGLQEKDIAREIKTYRAKKESGKS